MNVDNIDGTGVYLARMKRLYPDLVESKLSSLRRCLFTTTQSWTSAELATGLLVCKLACPSLPSLVLLDTSLVAITRTPEPGVSVVRTATLFLLNEALYLRVTDTNACRSVLCSFHRHLH